MNGRQRLAAGFAVPITPMVIVSLLVFAAASLGTAAAEPEPKEKLPILKTTKPVVSIQEGDTLRDGTWHLAPEMNPDIYEVELKDGKPIKVTFISDVDSISFLVEDGSQHDFYIQHGTIRCLTRIVGMKAVPAAAFDDQYRAARQGKISVEVPEVYELVNVAIALTPIGITDRALVYHDSAYYEAMLKWFSPQSGHPVVAALNAALKQNLGFYGTLKMNGYSFEFDSAGMIRQSAVYDRTAFPGERRNTLRPFIAALQDFATKTNFREFYAEHRQLYAEQIAFYEKEADVKGMLAWLSRNFPASSGYDSYKIIFSPLVAHNQSATWIESNGFKEIQAHVNYPYPEEARRRVEGASLSKQAETLLRGDIVFTELNHGYINPEADKYSERVVNATSRRDYWVDPAKGPSYYPGISCFNEYMNWGLVSLRAVDLAPAAEQAALVKIVDDMMTTRRGFPRFAAFDAFLVDLYRGREPGKTLPDLYPRIIEWFEKENGPAAAAAAQPGR